MMNVKKEIILLNKVLPFVLVELEDEIETRSGYSIMEINQLFVRLNFSNIIERKDYKIMFAFLNEVCNGIYILDYISEEELKRLDVLMDKIRIER